MTLWEHCQRVVALMLCEILLFHLPSSIVNAKLASAVKEASQYFYQEWKECMYVPIDAISEQFSKLKTGKQDVVVSA